MPDNPPGEEIFPNIQPEPPLAQPAAVSSPPDGCWLGEGSDLSVRKRLLLLPAWPGGTPRSHVGSKRVSQHKKPRKWRGKLGEGGKFAEGMDWDPLLGLMEGM